MADTEKKLLRVKLVVSGPLGVMSLSEYVKRLEESTGQKVVSVRLRDKKSK